MNEARVYADGFERSFAEVKDLLEFLAERGRNAKWIRKPTNTLRLAPLEKEAQNLDAADASMEEILEDTEKNTQLVLKMRGESYPVRDCAIRTILSRAGVNGDGLRKLDKATYAKVVNYCLRVAKGDALIKIADGKVSAVHGGDKHDYCIRLPYSPHRIRLSPCQPETNIWHPGISSASQRLDSVFRLQTRLSLRWKADGRAESMELSIRWKISWRLYHGQRRVS